MSIENINMKEAALAYAKQGIPVFPCIETGERAKAPYIDGGFKNATTDPLQLNLHWTKYQKALIGTPTGLPSGIDALDLDVDATKGKDGVNEWEKLCKAQGIEPYTTKTNKTPRGGKHLLFKHKVGFKNSVDKIANGIDTRGEGGYIILPPSSIDGKSYESINDLPLGDIPDFIMDIIAPKEQVSELSNDKSEHPKAQPQKPQQAHYSNITEEDDIRAALDSIPSNCNYLDWVQNGQALHSWNAIAGFPIWNAWSSKGSKYKEGECATKWKSFKSLKGITIATLFGKAKEYGYSSKKGAEWYGKAEQKEEAKKEPEEWISPIDLVKTFHIDEPDFSLLPKILQDISIEIERMTNIPKEMIFAAVIGLAGAALRNKFQLQIKKGHTVYGNLYILIVSDSTGGKSPLLKPLQAPFDEYEEKLYIEYLDKKAENDADTRIVETQLNEKQKLIRGEKNSYNLGLLKNEMKELYKQLNQDLFQPGLISTNLTSEAAAQLCKANGGAVAIITAEGRDFITICNGKYSKDGDDIGFYLKASNGEQHTSHRANGKNINCKPVSAIVVMVQPDSYRTLGYNPSLRDSGFLPRFATIFSKAQPRLYPLDTIPDDVQNSYNEVIYNILDFPRDLGQDGNFIPLVISLSDEARHFYKEYKDSISVEAVRNINSYSSLHRNTLDKLTDHVARIALILHVFEYLDTPTLHAPINIEIMERAIRIADYLRSHIEKATSVLGENIFYSNAVKIRDWIYSNIDKLVIERDKEKIGRIEAVKKSDIQQLKWAGLDKATTIEEAFIILQEFNWIRKKKIASSGIREHEVYEINPLGKDKILLYTPSTFTTSSTFGE